jgi:hypothetical protein
VTAKFLSVGKWDKFIRAGTTVTLAPAPFPIFHAALCSTILHPYTSKKVQYFGDVHVSEVLHLVSRSDVPGA